MKNLTPYQAYKMVEVIAKKNKMTVSAWAEQCNVRKSTVSHWKCRRPKSVLVATLEKLGIKI